MALRVPWKMLEICIRRHGGCKRYGKRVSILQIWWDGRLTFCFGRRCDDDGADTLRSQWKNKHADGPLNAKKPKKVKERQKRQEAERQEAIQQPNELASTGDEDTEPGNKEGVAVQID